MEGEVGVADEAEEVHSDLTAVVVVVDLFPTVTAAIRHLSKPTKIPTTIVAAVFTVTPTPRTIPPLRGAAPEEVEGLEAEGVAEVGIVLQHQSVDHSLSQAPTLLTTSRPTPIILTITLIIPPTRPARQNVAVAAAKTKAVAPLPMAAGGPPDITTSDELTDSGAKPEAVEIITSMVTPITTIIIRKAKIKNEATASSNTTLISNNKAFQTADKDPFDLCIFPTPFAPHSQPTTAAPTTLIWATPRPSSQILRPTQTAPTPQTGRQPEMPK